MYVIYYWMHEEKTGVEYECRFDQFIGDIGDIVIIDEVRYIIDDLTEDYVDFEEPEDF